MRERSGACCAALMSAVIGVVWTPAARGEEPQQQQAAQPPVEQPASDEFVDNGLPPEPLAWNPKWGDVDAVDYGVIGGAAAIVLAAALIKPLNPRPSHGVLFDDAAREAIASETTRARYVARDTSDILLSLFATWPFFVDAFVIAYYYRSSPDVAYRMAIISGEVLTLTGAIQGATNTLVGRERPYGRNCGGSLAENLYDCARTARYRSFFSGHSALSFASAGLICTHHLKLDLLGGGWPDLATCLVSIASAATTASLRVVGDVHYATDVITGSLVGAAIGFLVPALHYGFGEDTPDGPSVSLELAPTTNGLSLFGRF